MAKEPKGALAELGNTKLSNDWYVEVLCADFDPDSAGIYYWEIEDGDSYVGRYTSISRPRNEYRHNVERILGGRPSHHRDGKFRRIHYALASAVKNRKRITLTILVNCDRAELNSQEQKHIRSKRPSLNGPEISRSKP